MAAQTQHIKGAVKGEEQQEKEKRADEITRRRRACDSKRRRQAFQSSYMPVKSAETTLTHTHTHSLVFFRAPFKVMCSHITVQLTPFLCSSCPSSLRLQTSNHVACSIIPFIIPPSLLLRLCVSRPLLHALPSLSLSRAISWTLFISTLLPEASLDHSVVAHSFTHGWHIDRH